MTFLSAPRIQAVAWRLVFGATRVVSFATIWLATPLSGALIAMLYSLSRRYTSPARRLPRAAVVGAGTGGMWLEFVFGEVAVCVARLSRMAVRMGATHVLMCYLVLVVHFVVIHVLSSSCIGRAALTVSVPVSSIESVGGRFQLAILLLMSARGLLYAGPLVTMVFGPAGWTSSTPSRRPTPPMRRPTRAAVVGTGIGLVWLTVLVRLPMP